MDSSKTTTIVDHSANRTFPIPPAAIALPVLALLTLLLDLPPLVWHIRNRNLAASSLVSYIFLANFMNLLNTFIWPTDDISSWWPGYGLCDLEVKLQLAISIGVITSLLCIMRNLARVLDTDRAVMSLRKAQRRRQMAVELLLCFGAPCYMMGIHYIVQSSRYYIFAISGCTCSVDDSWPTVVLIFIWPPIFCFAVLYYTVLVILRMHRYRHNFIDILSASNSSLTRNRFFRLFFLALTLIIVFFPVEIFLLYKNAANTFSSYSWDRVHEGTTSVVVMVPTEGVVTFDRWIQIGAGIFVFGFFGCGQEAMKGYRKGLCKIGLGRVFPNLQRERTESSEMGSRTSYSSRARIFVAKKFSRNSAHSLPSNHPVSPTSPRSPTQPMAQASHLSAKGVVCARDSESTAPSTHFSTEKQAVLEHPQKLSWLKRFFLTKRIASRERQGTGISRAAKVDGGSGGRLDRSESAKHEKSDSEVWPFVGLN